MPAPSARVRLRPGLRTCRRAPGLVQVGLHDDLRLVLTDGPEARALLRVLQHGVDPLRLTPRQAELLADLDHEGLVVPADDPARRARLRESAGVVVEAPEPERSVLLRLLTATGVAVAPGDRADGPGVRLVVTTGAEPRRRRLDDLMRADRAHLLVTEVAGRVRVGPCVVPGLTACLRCIDEHLTDRDPRHPLVVEQHLDVDVAGRAPDADRQLALAWAVRDLTALVEGERPSTWSATVDLRPEGPVTRSWSRHPRCGCAWGDALVG
jgi:hypothetical protein